MPGEDWEHYCKRSLRNFGKALLKEATDVELEAIRLAMDKAEYAHLVLALDTTDYEVQPEERAGNWVLSNTDLGNWGLKCVKREPAVSRRNPHPEIISIYQETLIVPKVHRGRC